MNDCSKPILKDERVSSDPSCEDDGTIQTLNMFVRTRTDSGKPLSDMVGSQLIYSRCFFNKLLFLTSIMIECHIFEQEILEQVTVLNLDTGEQIPLSIAEDKLPQCLNPLSLHIMRLTSEYIRLQLTALFYYRAN